MLWIGNDAIAAMWKGAELVSGKEEDAAECKKGWKAVEVRSRYWVLVKGQSDYEAGGKKHARGWEDCDWLWRVFAPRNGRSSGGGVKFLSIQFHLVSVHPLTIIT